MIKKVLFSLAVVAGFAGGAVAQQRTCGTMSHLELLEKQFPGTKNQLQQLDRRVLQQQQQQDASGQRQSNAVITIPVVVHVVYNTAAQNISQAQIQSQLDVLNEDFNRLNSDSVNTPGPFRSAAGRMQIQFVLAKRDPNGDPTTGITRTQTTKLSFTDDDGVKFASRGGVNAWDRDRYLNLWVCNLGSGLLGYAQFPGSGPANTDGVVIKFNSFGRVGTLSAPYNKGRTATHEVGHWFSLYHIWGDEPACAQDDLVNDTPLQKEENYGCPTFPLTAGAGAACSGFNTNGAMFMNFMDYTDDACMNLFTKGQAQRVQNAIAASRPTLGASNGGQAVVVLNLDASIFKINSPIGSSCNPQFTPKVVLKNKGTTTLTSATISYKVNNGAAQTYNWTGSLATFATTEITLPVQNLAPGNHTFTAATSLPNGQTDNDALNDSQTAIFAITPQVAGQSLPYAESFESATFPGPGITLKNPDNDYTWERSNVAKHGSKSAFVNNYDYYYIGEADELIFSPLNLTTATNPELTFQVAYTPTSFTSTFGDTLEVLASTDCGFSFTSLYKKTGQALSTASPTFSSFVPTSSQWRMETISLQNLASFNNVVFKFKHTTGYENNLYLDDIRVGGVLGTHEAAAQQLFSVYPNPTSGLLTLQLEKEGAATVSVRNALGQEIMKKQFRGNKAQLDLKGQAAGVYFIQVISGAKNLTQKVILSE